MSDGFRINKAYADNYNKWRQKEELQKLRDKYGNVDDNSDTSSTSESEDEDAEALTEQVEKDWLCTLAALKSKDPKIYQKDVKFYHEEEQEDEDSSTDGKQNKKQKKDKKEKPMYLKDYERKVILEKGGVLSEEDSDQDEMPSSLGDKIGYYEEQESLRKSIAAAVEDSDNEFGEDKLLQKRQKTREEKTKDEEDYIQWMKGQKDKLDTDKQVGVELAPLKNYWERPDLDAGEKFLKNYILNKQYIDKDDESFPTYDEVVDDGEGYSDEEELLTKQDTFERKYNFRFEEPDATEVKTFPRTLEDTVRRKDTKRAEKRKEVKERKQREKEKKKEEIKQMKNLKRQEIMTKIEKLREITGNQSLAFDEKDLEEDFDPKKHDEMMQKYFDAEYYDDGEGEDAKPVMDDMFDDDLEAENWDNWTGEPEPSTSGEAGPSTSSEAGAGTEDQWEEGPYAEDDDFNMDADYDPLAVKDKKKNKKKKKNKLAEALSKSKPVFDPSEKTFEQYFDEYYKLDYEDIIGDMPCRFKYRKVTPNTYGLTVDEIVKSKDKELNSWVSLKKMSQYMTEEEEDRDVMIYTNKGRNVRRKQNILFSLYQSENPEEDGEETGEGQKGKRKRKKKKKNKQNENETSNIPSNEESSQVEVTDSQDSGIVTETNQGGNKRKNEITDGDDGLVSKKQKSEESETVAADGKKKKKMKKSIVIESSETRDTSEIEIQDNFRDSDEKKELKFSSKENANETQNENSGKKKKRKNKKSREDQKLKLSDERLKAYGINPKKYKYMQKDELFQVKPRKEKKS